MVPLAHRNRRDIWLPHRPAVGGFLRARLLRPLRHPLEDIPHGRRFPFAAPRRGNASPVESESDHHRDHVLRHLLEAARGRASVARPSSGRPCLIRIEAAVIDRLRAMRRPGESYSDVILRLAEAAA